MLKTVNSLVFHRLHFLKIYSDGLEFDTEFLCIIVAY